MNTSSKLQNQIEIWKIINNTDKKYSVSNIGRVKSNGFYAKLHKGRRFVKPKILKNQKHNQGYLTVGLGNGNSKTVHRLVANAFIPNYKNLEFVNHINGNKEDNRVENLEWVTRQENENHAFSTGLKNSTGESNTMSKLTKEQVYFIKYKEKRGRGIATTLESKYGVSRATIQRIWNNNIWQHI